MLSIFPSLFMLQGFGPFFLRLTIGLIFILWGRSKFKQGSKSMRQKQIGGLEFVVGILLILGYLTQPAALAAIIILAWRLVGKIKAKAFFTDGVNYYFILLIIAFSLLLMGPGFLAFDYPL